MYAAVSASTDSVRACGPGPAAPSLSAAATKDASVSARSGQSYASLRGRDRFSAAYRGHRHSVGGVVVITSKGHSGIPQVAVVAGKRVGNAVRRNRAKRRLRAALGRIRLTDGMTYIVIARNGAADAPFDRLVSWLQSAVDAGEGGRQEERIGEPQPSADRQETT